MKCPVCKRELAPTISICYACGTMVQDSVREELATKIGRVSRPLEVGVAASADRSMGLSEVSEPKPLRMEFAEPKIAAEAPKRAPRNEPTERIRRHTSKTLVDFQNKKSNVPDWRLQLQNAVRQRQTDVVATAADTNFQAHLITNGANALKAQVAPQPETNSHANPRVANALRRIEDSRKKFISHPEPKAAPAPASKNYPFNVVARTEDAPATPRPATVNAPPKPRLVSSPKFERRGFDTNKLPPLPDTIPTAPAVSVPREIGEPAFTLERSAEPEKIEICRVEQPAETHDHDTGELAFEEVDDLASFSSRFTAGVFDVIIGGFATAILMWPLLMRGGEWLSVAGVLAIMAAFGIVMFTYLTVGIGLRGRTVGMKLFSLEVIDIEQNEYPTFHQAAVSSAVFLLALPLLGIGFLPALFNEERRAAHDLVSGTLLVREV